jgi:hypothetical protein
MVHRLFAFAVAPDALDALDETTDFLERGSQSQPQYLAQRGRRIAANRLILARSLPGREELQALANRSRQLNLWRRAA